LHSIFCFYPKSE